MCGIAGAVAGPETPLAADLGRIMAARLAHRGPDGEGHFAGEAPLGPARTPRAVVLAHRRLAIIDLSEAAAEPLPNEDGSVLVVFNGEIYNHRALRARLEAEGHRFRSRCDAEVLVHLYEDRGPACVEELRGMYAFAILDRRRGELFLARDPAGKKPLHLARLPGGGLAFASEIAPLLDAGAAREVDRAALDEYLALGYIAAPRTGFASVRKLPPGGALLFSEGLLHELPRVELGRRDPPRPGEGWRAALRVRVTDAVRARLESDVPLGAFLSGGVDSTLVVGVAARLLAAAGAPALNTFSIGFREARWNESAFAHLAARFHGTVHHERLVGPESAAALPEIVFRHGEPFADESSLATYEVARFARERVAVVLSGDGGDELFLGYRHHRAARALALLDRFVPRGLRRRLARLAPREGEERSVRRQAGRLLGSLALAPEERYLAWAGIFPERGAAVAARVRDLGIARHDLEVYLPDDILAKVDRATMAHGLEARAPLLDRHVVALARAMPPALNARLPWESKRALKTAFPDLIPPAIARRRKMGFGVPIGVWLRGPLRTLAQDVLRSERFRGRGVVPPEVSDRLLLEHDRGKEHGRKIYALLALEAWFRQMVDPARPERVDW